MYCFNVLGWTLDRDSRVESLQGINWESKVFIWKRNDWMMSRKWEIRDQIQNQRGKQKRHQNYPIIFFLYLLLLERKIIHLILCRKFCLTKIYGTLKNQLLRIPRVLYWATVRKLGERNVNLLCSPNGCDNRYIDVFYR